jgi:ubiquitin carboxyl-terminal hydrolase 22/27/51
MLPYTTLYVSPEHFTNSTPEGATTNGTSSHAADQPNGSKPAAESFGANPAPPSYDALLAEPREFWPSDLASYALSAVIVHKGEINSGHYVNYAREGRDWFLFDDSKVVRVDEGEVLKAEAYLLIYVLADLTPWMDAGDSA